MHWQTNLGSKQTWKILLFSKELATADSVCSFDSLLLTALKRASFLSWTALRTPNLSSPSSPLQKKKNVYGTEKNVENIQSINSLNCQMLTEEIRLHPRRQVFSCWQTNSSLLLEDAYEVDLEFQKVFTAHHNCEPSERRWNKHIE